MLRPSPGSVSWADKPLFRSCCSDFRAAPSEKLFPQQRQFALLHSESLQSSGEARRRARSSSSGSNGDSSSLAASSVKVASRPRGPTGRFESGLSCLDGRKFTRKTTLLREGRRRTVMRASRDDERAGLGKEGNLNVPQILETVAVRVQGGNIKDDVVEVQIEKLGNNSRKIVAKITIEAPLDNIWAILTDYENLGDFIPGLAVNELLEKRRNGARLYQVGEQNIALGVKFRAKAVVDCEEKPTTVHKGYIRRDIDFQNVEGDFQIFRGTWRMEQPVSKTSSDSSSSPAAAGRGGGGPGGKLATILSYILVVQPQIWLPVALVEGRLTSEMKTNLVCIRERSLQPSLRRQ